MLLRRRVRQIPNFKEEMAVSSSQSSLPCGNFFHEQSYQRVSPDILPVRNGSKPSLRTCKEDDPDHSGRIQSNSHFEPAKSLRARPGSGSANRSPSQDHHSPHGAFSADSPAAFSEHQSAPSSSATPSASVSPARTNNHHEDNGIVRYAGGGCDVLLQWGQNKRSRRSRTERPAAVVVAGGGVRESSYPARQPTKIQRRSAIAAAEKVAAVAAVAAMPPPCGSYTRGTNLRPCTPLREAAAVSPMHNSRTVEERSSGQHRPEKRSPPLPTEKSQKISANGNSNGGSAHQQQPSDQDTGGSVATAVAAMGEKLNLDRFEWPRIYISLSRKEKEDDFFAMKGTKLPQRPKKRAKNVDKTLQYCFPGMWLSDLTRSRYEVREKKCVKKRRRGLKGMESMDSDSE